MGIIVVYGLIKEVSMLKFQFDYWSNTLAYWKDNNTKCQIAEERQFQGDFNSQGFKLDHGWISFTTYENKIRAFYKQIDSPAWFTYYRKDLPKQAPIIFEFNDADEVEKVGNQWQKKGGIHA